MESVLIFVLVFLFLILLNRPKQLKDLPCDVHKWKYDIGGQMFCEVCKRRPSVK